MASMKFMRGEVKVFIISATAIGAMLALEEVGLRGIVSKNPFIWLILFLVITAFSGKIDEVITK